MFSQTEILLMIFVVSVLLLFIIVLTVLDIIEYRKNKNMIEEATLDEEDTIKESLTKKMEEVTITEVEDEIEPVKSTYKEESDKDLFIEMEEEVPVKKEIVESSNYEMMEYEPLISEVEEDNNVVAPEITYNDYQKETLTRVNLNEELSKVEETMVEEDEITKKALSFEEEQERTAIISLDELMQKSDNLYNENEISQYDDGNEPISIDEVISMYNKEEKEINIPEVNAIVEEKINEPKEEKKELYTKREDIPFISSVYGIEKNEMSFENTATYDKLDREKTNEFMRELRERIENQ